MKANNTATQAQGAKVATDTVKVSLFKSLVLNPNAAHKIEVAKLGYCLDAILKGAEFHPLTKAMAKQLQEGDNYKALIKSREAETSYKGAKTGSYSVFSVLSFMYRQIKAKVQEEEKQQAVLAAKHNAKKPATRKSK